MATVKVRQSTSPTRKALPVRPARAARVTAPPASQLVRQEYSLSQALLAKILNIGRATLARWEKTGKPPKGAAVDLREVAGLLKRLADIMPKTDIASWLTRPNDACRPAGGRTPADLMEQGRYDKIEAMIYFFESGTAY